jgi:hypothetical protein
MFPKEIWFIIIKYQILIGDLNPTIFCKEYQKYYQEYIKKFTNWEESSFGPKRYNL